MVNGEWSMVRRIYFIIRTHILFMRVLKYLFDFRKPEIEHFEYFEVVIEDKQFLVLSWVFKRRYKMRIPAIKKSFRSVCGTRIEKIDVGKVPLAIKISSLWRKTTLILILKPIKLDQETADVLIRSFSPFKMPTPLLYSFHSLIQKPIPLQTAPVLTLKNVTAIPIPEPKMTHMNIALDSHHFIFNN